MPSYKEKYEYLLRVMDTIIIADQADLSNLVSRVESLESTLAATKGNKELLAHAVLRLYSAIGTVSREIGHHAPPAITTLENIVDTCDLMTDHILEISMELRQARSRTKQLFDNIKTRPNKLHKDPPSTPSTRPSSRKGRVMSRPSSPTAIPLELLSRLATHEAARSPQHET